MKRILLFIFLTLVASTSVFAQVINWQTAAGGSHQLFFYDMVLTPDSGFVVASELFSPVGNEVTDPPFGDTDYWIVKYSSQRKIQWQRRIGGSGMDGPQSLKITRDGCIIVGGTSGSPISGNKTEASVMNDAWIVKLDPNGNIIWQNTIRATDDEYLACMDTTLDNGVIMAITTKSGIGLEKTVPLYGVYDCWLVKLDSSGNVQWQNVIVLPGYDLVLIEKIVQLSDGGYVALGRQGIDGTGISSPVLLRLDSLGNLIWNQPFFSSGGNDYIEALEVTSDGSFLVGTHSSGGISPWKSDSLIGYEDVWLLKFDSVGNFLWDNSYGSTNTDQIFDICLSTSGDIYLIGRSNSNIGFDKTERCWGDFDYWVLKVSNNGIKLWDKTIGGKGIDTGYRIKLLANEDILIGGYSWSPSGCDRRNFLRGYTDFWLMSLTENFNEITGNVFTDMNLNSIKDSGDFVPQNLKIQTTDSNYHSFVSYDGTYKMLVADSTYDFLTESNPYFGVNPALNTAIFTGFKQIDSLNDFILHPNVFIQDLKITLAPPAMVRPGFSATYMISCENKGTVPVPAQIYFRLYPNISYVSSTSIPILLTSDSVMWDIGVIVPGQSKIMSVTVKLDTSIQVGSILNSYARALPIVTDYAPSDNNATWESIVRGSFDPNDILVDKRTIEYNTLPSNPVLRYTIRFQNTGNAPATIVSVINNLPSKLLDSSFEFEASSHPVNIEYTQNSRMLKFDFPGIVLPDSGTNNEQSMGFVQYSIRPLTNLLPGDTIRNKAFIYFDYNSPVITNNAVTAIVQTTSINEWVANGKLNMYPNPARDVLNISLPESYQQGMLMVYDLQGRLIWNEKVIPSNEIYRMNTLALDPGMYTILYVSGNSRYSSRFVKL
jgi:hypothetical protein